MKYVLVQPFTHGKASVRPLGLGYLASALLQHGENVRVIDNDVARDPTLILAARVVVDRPDLVGISANIINQWNALELASLLPKDLPVVFGGPQPTLDPARFVSPHRFIIRGEAEHVLPLFLRRHPRETPSLSWHDGSAIAHNPIAPPIRDLDTIAFPSMDLFDVAKYRFSTHGQPSVNVITSRGCGGKCIYCYHQANTRFRQRSVENVIQEVTLLKERYGFQAIKFFDDNFTTRKRFVADICGEMKRLGLWWQCLSSARSVSEDLLHLMAQSGCKQINFGIESGSQRSLDLMGKKTTVEQNRCAIRWCRKAGITSKAYMIIGFPWETSEDIALTKQFIRDATPDLLQLFFATPFPNTDLEALVKQSGYPIDSAALMGARDFVVPSFETAHLSRQNLLGHHQDIRALHQKLTRRGLVVRAVRKLRRIWRGSWLA